jgi:hypothetical protein
MPKNKFIKTSQYGSDHVKAMMAIYGHDGASSPRRDIKNNTDMGF